MVEVRTKFTLSFGKVIKVLISDKYPENQIFISWIEKILQDDVGQRDCVYYEECFIFQFGRGIFKDCAECKVSPWEDHEIVFGKP